MRYVIIGAGAIGGALAARLSQANLSSHPLLVARGANGVAIAKNGLRLRTPDDDTVVLVDTVAAAREARLRIDDVLVFATKTQQVDAALHEWVDVAVFDADGADLGTAGEVLPVFMALNGVESERIASRLFERVFGICVWMPAVQLEPGEVILRIAPQSGTFIIGRFGAEASDEDRVVLDTLAADWGASTFAIHVVDDVMRWKYRKLLSNLGNAVQALLGADTAPGDVPHRLRDEARALYREAGITWATRAEEEAWRGDVFNIRPVPGTPAELGGSTWQSVARGAPTIETDYLNGEIALLAHLHGLRAPLNAAVQRLSRQMIVQPTRTSMTLAELEAQLPR